MIAKTDNRPQLDNPKLAQIRHLPLSDWLGLAFTSPSGKGRHANRIGDSLPGWLE